MSQISWTFANRAVYDPRALYDDLKPKGVDAAALRRCNAFHDNRGRAPSVGHLLMLRRDVEGLSQDSQHSLVLTDGNRTKRWKKLSIVASRAVWPSATDGKTTPTTPYVVTVADARAKAELSYANASFNRLLGDNDAKAPRLSVKDVSRVLWQSLRPLFGAELRFDVKDEAAFDLAFHGVSAWDALWSVWNMAGWSFRIRDGLPEVFEVKPETTRIHGPEYDGDYWLQRPTLPRTIVAVCQKRDYQWQATRDAETAGDAHRLDPVHELRIDTRNLVAGVEAVEEPDKAVVPHLEGEKAVWVPVALSVASTGAVNQAGVEAMMRRYARRWLDAQIMAKRATSYSYIGLQRVTPSSRWGCVSFADHGDGLTTRLGSVECSPEGERVAGSSFRPGPPNGLDWAPYCREAWVQIEGPTNPSGDSEDSVGPNQEANVLLRAGTVVAGQLIWTTSKPETAMNTTGKTLKRGQEGFARWNYQLGRWCVVSGGSSSSGPAPEVDLPDWASGCISGPAVSSYNDPSTVVVNRGTHLRLLALSRGRMGVEISEGPRDTVFNTGADGNIYWSNTPRSKNVWMINGRIWFDGGPFPASSIATGGAHLIMPPDSGRSHKYAIAELRGPNTVKIGWHGPGVDVTTRVPKCMTEAEKKEEFRRMLCSELLPYLCDYVSNCELYETPHVPGEDPCSEFECSDTGETGPDGEPLPPCPYEDGSSACDTWVFSNGLLVKHPDGRFPSKRTMAAPVFQEAINFNPCIEGGGGESGPGGGSDPDGNPIWPDPDDPDPDPDGGGPGVDPDGPEPLPDPDFPHIGPSDGEHPDPLFDPPGDPGPILPFDPDDFVQPDDDGFVLQPDPWTPVEPDPDSWEPPNEINPLFDPPEDPGLYGDANPDGFFNPDS